ncbi:MAG: DNA replication and repair protein RecF [Gammaproteobacteria bacterium]|nr:MAG: DNA replication and repair protein RecF [Gammaproteobacteria bacterium]
MGLVNLSMSGFRNFKDATLQPSSGFNILTGDVGAGKTSVLEAVYILSRNRSFRTGNLDKLISVKEPSFAIMADFKNENGFNGRLKLIRNKGKSEFYFNDEPIKKTALLSELIPSLYFGSNSQIIFTGSPSVRRKFIDWGVYHYGTEIKHAYSFFNRVLKQRNHTLKNHNVSRETKIWDEQVAEYGEKISQARKEYVDLLFEYTKDMTTSFFKNLRLSFKFNQGWPENKDLLSVLEQNITKDIKSGVTEYGPHRADIILKVNGENAAAYCSCGQQKILSFCLFMAQYKLACQNSNVNPIILIDDIQSELNHELSESALLEVKKLNSQVISTSLLKNINNLSFEMFHVKHNAINRVAS